MFRPARTLTASLALALSLGVGTVSAGGPPLDPEVAKAKAREEFRRGLSLEAAGDWGGALQAFKAVALVRSTPQVRFHIAQCEEKTGDYVGALGSYRLALGEANAANVDDVIVASELALAKLEPKIPKLTLKRGSGAGTATITLDGHELGASVIGAPFSINPGPHHLTASAPGRKSITLEIILADSEKKEVEIVLPEDARPASLVVSDAKAREEPKPVPGVPPTRVAGFVIGGLGLASLGVSGAFYALRQQTIDELDAACGPSKQNCPASLAPTRDRGVTYDLVSTATFFGGVGAVALGSTLLIVSAVQKPKAPAPQVKASAAFVPGSFAGVSVTGSF